MRLLPAQHDCANLLRHSLVSPQLMCHKGSMVLKKSLSAVLCCDSVSPLLNERTEERAHDGQAERTSRVV